TSPPFNNRSYGIVALLSQEALASSPVGSKLIRHAHNRFVPAAGEPAQAPCLVYLTAEARDEEITLRQAQNQTGRQVVVHNPAKLCAIVIDGVDHQEGERQQRAL